jgi:HK97 family phage major capsid protein
METKNMDKIQLKQDEIKALMVELENIEQGTEDFSSKLSQVEAAKLSLDSIKQEQERFAAVQASLSSFSAPKAVQAGPAKGAIVQEGFVNDPKFGFSNGGEFLQSIFKNGSDFSQDKRLSGIADIMQTAGAHTSIADGLMIPSEFAEGLLINESGISDDWVGKMNTEQTSSNSKTFKRSAANTTGGSVGLTASRIAENTQMSSTKEVFETTTLPLAKLYAYSDVTEEDLNDIPWLTGHLATQAPKVIRAKFAGELLNGTGVGEALGMFNTNNANKISVTRNTASNVKSEDIAAMYARAVVDSGSFWLINRDVMAKLPLMTVGDTPITWEPYFRNGMIGLMNGLPVYQSEDCSVLGTAGDVRLVTPSGYRCLEKVGGSQFASSIHVRFDYDSTAFRWTHRINGIPWCNDVYTPRNGATLSPFVQLGSA